MSAELTGLSVLIADDHQLFAQGLAALLKDAGCTTEIVTALGEIVPMLDRTCPTLLVLDLAFGDASAIPLLRKLRQGRPELPILVISASEEVVIIERVRETGAAYLAKSQAGEEMVTAVQLLLSGKIHSEKQRMPRRRRHAVQQIGGVHLNRSHVAVLQLLRRGLTNHEIATTLNRALKTVESHISQLYTRTGLHTRGHLIRWANEHAKALGGPLDGR